MPNVNYVQSKREIKIKTGRYEAIADVLSRLQYRLSHPENDEHPIESCVQCREVTYMKFKSENFALRAKSDLERNIRSRFLKNISMSMSNK